MAIAFTKEFGQATDLGSAQTTTTTSSTLTPVADTLYLASVFTEIGTAADSVTTLSGAGVTWVRLGSVRQATTDKQLSLFRAFGAGSTEALTFTRGGTDTFRNFGIIVTSVTGADPSGTNGSGAIAQFVSEAGDVGTTPVLPITMVDTDNSVYAVFATGDGGFTRTAVAPYTILAANTLATHFGHGPQYVNATSVTEASCVWNGSVTSLAVAVEVKIAPVGPTITVQPVAQTKILTNENTATFSVTATGTGSLSYDWELEDGVASGVYANLADGNGATWTGQAASSCTATLTAKTLTGRRVRCNVTDDNGTTTTNAVALTIFDGPQLTTFPATNGSGVSTAQLTSDFITEDHPGTAIEVRIPLSDGDVAVTVTTTAS